MDLFRVQGCGVTVICQKGESMTWWLKEIVTRGGVPTVERVCEELKRAA